MLIGYRRGSGKLPLTNNEKGARGTWLEKRLALLQALRQRNHQLLYWSEPTDNSKNDGYQPDTHQKVDLLIIEFAGTNMVFYGKDWALTCEMIKAHAGPILFLCDDPDLAFPWSLLPDENWSRWIIAVNAVNLNEARIALKIPPAAKIVDTPFASLIPTREHQTPTNAKVIYYGRRNGRTKQLQSFYGSNLEIAGKTNEWPGTSVITPPQQSDRANFYAQYAVCLALYDNKHAITGWRTGRAYHALNAGTVVAAPIGNIGLDWALQVSNHNDLTRLLATNLAEIHFQQTQKAKSDFPWEQLNL